jgi:hypothetical protein
MHPTYPTKCAYVEPKSESTSVRPCPPPLLAQRVGQARARHARAHYDHVIRPRPGAAEQGRNTPTPIRLKWSVFGSSRLLVVARGLTDGGYLLVDSETKPRLPSAVAAGV